MLNKINDRGFVSIAMIIIENCVNAIVREVCSFHSSSWWFSTPTVSFKCLFCISSDCGETRGCSISRTFSTTSHFF